MRPRRSRFTAAASHPRPLVAARVKANAVGGEPRAEGRGRLGIQKRQELGAACEQRHAHPQRRHDRGELAGDHARAGDAQALRQPFERAESGGVEHALVVEGHVRRPHRQRTRGQNDAPGCELDGGRGFAARDLQPFTVHQAPRAVVKVHAGARETAQHLLRLQRRDVTAQMREARFKE